MPIRPVVHPAKKVVILWITQFRNQQLFQLCKPIFKTRFAGWDVDNLSCFRRVCICTSLLCTVCCRSVMRESVKESLCAIGERPHNYMNDCPLVKEVLLNNYHIFCWPRLIGYSKVLLSSICLTCKRPNFRSRRNQESKTAQSIPFQNTLSTEDGGAVVGRAPTRSMPFESAKDRAVERLASEGNEKKPQTPTPIRFAIRP